MITSVPFDPEMLVLGRMVRATGQRPERQRVLLRVRRGVWIARTDWSAMAPVDRHAALVHATALQCPDSDALVFSHASAAALFGMPRIDPWPKAVDVLRADHRVRSSGLIQRREGPAAPTVLVRGLRVTAPARTVVDLSRTSSLGSALAAADYAVRVGLCTPQELAEQVADLPAYAPGARAARTVVGLADPRSMSVLESLSRAQMYVLSIPRPQLQVSYADADGFIGVVDFDWDGRVGECDGKEKYRVPQDATAEAATEILWQEKQREDRLRRRCRALTRWVWRDAVHPERLLCRLAEIGVRPQSRNSWLESQAG